jgi:hypothetical protein
MADDYEGLSLPQLLDLMHDLVVSPPVSLAPATPAWAVLFGWSVAVAVLAALKWRQRWRADAYRREALRVLELIARDTTVDAAACAGRVSALLKRTAMIAFSRREVAGLYGDAWAQFLVSSAGDDATIRAHAPQFARASSDPAADGRAMLAPARHWIRVHRA